MALAIACNIAWKSSVARCTPMLVNRFYSTQQSTEAEILEEKKGPAIILTLNRPKALNALNLSMVRTLTPKYKAWHSQSSPLVVIMKGAGAKAFCAGGDIRAMYDLGKAWAQGQTSGEHATAFFREEYNLNYLIATLPHPHVALLNGITMGGGVGLSVHGKFRVATENTVFAMPETGIGFFCDVGGSYFLPRLPGGLGLYLGLTGGRLKGGALVHAGVATHYMPAERLDKLQDALISESAPDSKKVKSILDSFALAPPSQDAIQHVETINRCFGSQHSTLHSVLAAVRAEAEKGDGWAKETLQALSRASPTSLAVVFKQIREGAAKPSIRECLAMEYRMADTFLRPDGPSQDFFEGVRATLVDKDKNYKWNPASLDLVQDSVVHQFFTSKPTGGELKL